MRQVAQKPKRKLCSRKTMKKRKTHPEKPEKGETGCVLFFGGRRAVSGGRGGPAPPSPRHKSQNRRCWFGAAKFFGRPKRAKSSQVQYNKNSAGVMIAGCVRPDSRKSLSPVRSTSALARMAARTSLGIVICPLAMTLALSTVSPGVV